MTTPDFDAARRWAKALTLLAQITDDDANLARAYLALEARLATMTYAYEKASTERDALVRKVERVRAVQVHDADLTGPVALLCDLQDALTDEEQT